LPEKLLRWLLKKIFFRSKIMTGDELLKEVYIDGRNGDMVKLQKDKGYRRLGRHLDIR